MKIFFRFAVLLLCVVCFGNAFSQSTANYNFTSGSNGSLTQDMNGNTINMSTGTTQLVGPSTDDGGSAATNIGFDFYLYGQRYTQFSATSNGLVGLGSTAAPSAGGSSNLVPYQVAGGSIASPKLGAMTADLYTSSTGKVHYKVVGTAPNRALVIEFLNMALPYSTTLIGGTYQVRLYERTGAIEYMYGAMSKNTDGGAYTALFSIGFSVGTTANTTASITTSTNTISNGATFNTNDYAVGVIADLNSAADGSRKYYRMVPPLPNAATNLGFTSVTSTGMTLNWTDNSTDEVGFAVYKSTDGGTTYNFSSLVAANTTSSVQTGLTPSTSYFWRVYAVSEGGMSTALQGSQSSSAAGNIVSNGTGGGLWSAGSTWVGGVAPSSGDNVTITAGDNVTIDMSPSILGLTVSGTLQYEVTTARTLTLALGATINTGGSILTGASGSVTTHVLSVAGNVTNNGILDLSIGTAGTGITFTGSDNSSFTGTGSTTDLYSLTLAKSALAQTVELNLSNFTVRGLSSAATGALLTSNTGTGTLKISGTNTFSGVLWSAAGYTIPATMGFWLNNPNFTVTGQNGSPTVTGLFRVSNGTYNIGTATGNSMGFSAASTIIVEGGSIVSTGRFGVAAAANAINYTQTGGTVTVCTIGNTSTTLGNFDLGTGLGSAITWTGGTVIVQSRSTAASGPRDYRFQSGGGSTAFGTGSPTLQLGNASTPASVQAFTITGVLPNLVITNTTANHTATVNSTVTNYNCLSLNITINTGCALTLLNNVFLFAGNTITNNGTFASGGTSCRFITFAIATNVTYTGTGTVTAPFNSLELQNDLNFTIDPASSNIVCTRIISFSGTFVNANKLTMGNGGSTTATIQMGNTTTPAGAVGLDGPPTYNLGTGGLNVSALRSTNSLSLNFLPPSRTLNNLTIDPDAGNTVNLTGGDAQVTGTLALTTGFLNLGGNTLTLGTSAAAPGTLSGSATNVINGTFKRWIAASIGNIVFPIGTQVTTDALNNGHNITPSTERFYSSSTELNAGTVGYRVQDDEVVDSKSNKNKKSETPVSLNRGGSGNNNIDATTNYSRTANVNYTVAPSTGGTLSAQWVSTPGGTNGLPLNEGGINITTTSVDGFWRFTAADGLAGGTYDVTLTATGILGVNDYTQLALVKRNDGSSAWTLDGTHVTTTGSNAAPVLSRTGITSTPSDFAVGGNAALNPLPVELSSFTSATNRSDVSLSWTTVSESNNQGFDIERKVVSSETWSKVGTVSGHGNSNSTESYSFTDRNVSSAKYNYRLKQIDFNGNYKYYNLTSLVEVGVPGKFALSQNYPNPFNPSTKINYDLPFDSKVSIRIFDMTGKEVANLVNNSSQTAGYYTVQFNGVNMASGIYFYTIAAEGGNNKFISTKKMVLVK